MFLCPLLAGKGEKMEKLQSLPDACFPNLGLIFQDLERTAVSIFGFDIYWYGVFICTAVIIGHLVLYHNAKTSGQDPDVYLDFVFFGIISGICGARIYYLLFNERSLRNFFAFRDGGLAIYGGVIAMIIAVAVYTRIKKLNFLQFTDTYAPPLILGQAIGRLGNFVNREAFGRATQSFFALMYKAKEVPNLRVKGGIALYLGKTEYPVTWIENTAYISVHPTFLYELTCNICIFIFMMLYRKHKKFEGEMSALYFVCYGSCRFFSESLRTDQLKIGTIPVSMLFSGVMVILSMVFIVFMRKRARLKA